MAVNLSSSWSLQSGSLNCSIVGSIENFDAEDICTENCSLLVKCDSDVRGELIFEAPSGVGITGILLVTDRPRWELLGGIEFLCSVQGKLLDNFDDVSVYTVQRNLNKVFERITLRLPPPAQSCWLYAVQVTTSLMVSQKVGHFDVNSVNQILGDSKQLSNNAQKFKSVFDMFQATHNSSSFMQLSSNIGNLMLNPPVTLSGGKNNTSSELPLQQSERSNASPTTDTNQGSLLQPHDDNFMLLKMYIDQKFISLERNIMKSIEDRDRVINSKLDLIINKVNDKETSS